MMARRKLTSDERALWRAVTVDVQPMALSAPEPAAAIEQEPAKPPVKPAKPPVKPVKPAPKSVVRPQPPAPSPHRLDLAPGQTDGLDRRRMDRLKRGREPIDGKIDLHGLNQEAAHRLIERYIIDSVAAGRRCILVVTGKGPVSQGGGILRRRLADWLNLPTCRPHILGFVQAQPQHGGGGAFYVLLRRRRQL